MRKETPFDLPRYEPPPEIWEALERRIRRREHMKKWGVGGLLVLVLTTLLIGVFHLRTPSISQPDRELFAHYYQAQIRQIDRALRDLEVYETRFPKDSLIQRWKQTLLARRNRVQTRLTRYTP